MDNNILNNKEQGEIELTRICKCCGKELPLRNFNSMGRNRYSKVCNSCKRQKKGISEKFKDFTAIELMEELRSRGFHGTLKHTRVEEINI